MPLDNVQIGVIAQNEFAKLLVIWSNGRLEVSWPMTDDDRRDGSNLTSLFGRAEYALK